MEEESETKLGSSLSASKGAVDNGVFEARNEGDMESDHDLINGLSINNQVH